MKILVTGAGGQLGTDVVTRFEKPGHHQVVGLSHAELDVADRDAVLQTTGVFRPDLIVHAAAWTAVDACESDPERAWAVNALGARHVAEGAARARAHLVHISTDYVFDGSSDRPYTEWDTPNPQSVYGRSKWGGEQEVRGLLGTAAVVRTAWVCSAHGHNMVDTALRLSATGSPLYFVDDQHGCPTFTEDLADALYDLAVARWPGTFHLTNQGPTTWYRFVCEVVKAAGGDPAQVRPITTAELDPPRPAPRPANSVLDNVAWRQMGQPLLADYHEPLERTVRALLSR